MKFTALIREVVTRDIRVIVIADSKGQAKRKLMSRADTDDYKEGIVMNRTATASLNFESIEPLTPESFRS